MVLVKLLDQGLRVRHFRGGEPGILGTWISLPLDQIQDPSSIQGHLGLQDRFNFVMFVFSFDDLGRGSGEVWSMSVALAIWGNQGIVEDWMNVPGLWQLEFAINSPGGQNLERPMSSWGQLGFGVHGMDVGSFQPD